MAMSSAVGAPRLLEVSVATGDALDIRNFHVVERMNELFEVTIDALCENPDIDLEAVAGQPMTFTARKGVDGVDVRTWTGICRHIEQAGVQERGLSTYRLVLVPVLWLMTQRRNHRMFQVQSEVDIARKLLGEWGIPTEESLSGTYKKRKYRVQYGESDFTFLCRMLEDAGISFYFRTEDRDTKLVLHDAPQSNVRRAPPIAFRDNPTVADREHVTAVRIGRSIRTGKYTVRDHDYRRSPAYNLRSSANAGGGIEEELERFDYSPGAFLYEGDGEGGTPVADDRGGYRTDEREAGALAKRRLEAERGQARTVTFETNTLDLGPGTTVSFLDHPKSELSAGKALLVTQVSLRGEANGTWVCTCEAVSTEVSYRPAVVTAKPKTSGVESATVVGPAGEEIHTDEFGRVRVHFHWDRESKMNETSSCWIHTSQPWSGSGFGGTYVPRVGQEVVVDFLGGDPDRPIIVGRVYTNLQ
ncbi:MAG: type VI secretion system tip protein TssI/VgrG, partial [Minicystis sp.]